MTVFHPNGCFDLMSASRIVCWSEQHPFFFHRALTFHILAQDELSLSTDKTPTGILIHTIMNMNSRTE